MDKKRPNSFSRREVLVGAMAGLIAGACSNKENNESSQTTPIEIPKELSNQEILEAEQNRVVIEEMINDFTTTLTSKQPSEVTTIKDQAQITYKGFSGETGYIVNVLKDAVGKPVMITAELLTAIDPSKPNELQEYSNFMLSANDQLVGFSKETGGYVKGQRVPQSFEQVNTIDGCTYHSTTTYADVASSSDSIDTDALGDNQQSMQISASDMFRQGGLSGDVLDNIGIAIANIN